MFSLLSSTVQKNIDKIQHIISSTLTDVDNMDVSNVSKLIMEYAIREPMKIYINTKKYLYFYYHTDEQKIKYFEDKIYDQEESWCHTKYTENGTIFVNTEYNKLLQECCIEYLNYTSNSNSESDIQHIFVNGDIIVDKAYDRISKLHLYNTANNTANHNVTKKVIYNHSNLLYINGEITDLYQEQNENGTYPPEMCYPTIRLDFVSDNSLLSNKNCLQWLDCNAKDFRKQLLSNLKFITFYFTNNSVEDKLFLLTTKVENVTPTGDVDIIKFAIDCSLLTIVKTDEYIKNKGFISDDLQYKLITHFVKYFKEVDKICFTDKNSLEHCDTLFHKFGVYIKNDGYYGLDGGVIDDRFNFIYE